MDGDVHHIFPGGVQVIPAGHMGGEEDTGFLPKGAVLGQGFGACHIQHSTPKPSGANGSKQGALINGAAPPHIHDDSFLFQKGKAPGVHQASRLLCARKRKGYHVRPGQQRIQVLQRVHGVKRRMGQCLRPANSDDFPGAQSLHQPGEFPADIPGPHHQHRLAAKRSHTPQILPDLFALVVPVAGQELIKRQKGSQEIL